MFRLWLLWLWCIFFWLWSLLCPGISVVIMPLSQYLYSDYAHLVVFFSCDYCHVLVFLLRIMAISLYIYIYMKVLKKGDFKIHSRTIVWFLSSQFYVYTCYECTYPSPHLSLYMHKSMHVCVCIHAWVWHMLYVCYGSVCLNIFMCMYVSMHACVFMYVCMYVFMWIYIQLMHTFSSLYI